MRNVLLSFCALLLSCVALPREAAAFKMSAPHYPCTDCLNVGDTLTIGHSISSKNGAYRLDFQTDHNVVLIQTSTNTPVWSTNTHNVTAATKFWFLAINAPQELYLLALTDTSGTSVYWRTWNHAGTSGQFVQNPYFSVQNDGNLVVYQPSLAWQSNSDTFAGTDYDNRIGAVYFPSVSYIAAGSSWSHSNCTYAFQLDGNMTMKYYDVTSGLTNTLWSTNTTGNGVSSRFQDGNLLIYNSGRQVSWQTNNGVRPLAWMVWQADCNLVIWDSTPKWDRINGGTS